MLVVRLIIESLGSARWQDTFENRHWLELFKPFSFRDYTTFTILSPVLCTHYEHNSCISSAGWSKKRYMHRGRKGMWLEEAMGMMAFERMPIASVEFFQVTEMQTSLGNWETCFPPRCVICRDRGWHLVRLGQWVCQELEGFEWQSEEFECYSLCWRIHQICAFKDLYASI